MKTVVLVTGASRGLGAAIARLLDSAGARVALCARSRGALLEVACDLKDPLVLVGDLSVPRQAEAAVRHTLDRFGRLDALVSNAGLLGPVRPIASSPVEEWRKNLEVNLLAPFVLTRAALPALRRSRGRVVNIGTGAALKPVSGWSAYCASKAGLLHFTRVLAEEEPDIVAVSLRPGVIDTEMQAQIRREGATGMDPDKHASFETLKREGKLEPPEVPARAAAWLALHAPAEWSGELVEYTDERIGTL